MCSLLMIPILIYNWLIYGTTNLLLIKYLIYFDTYNLNYLLFLGIFIVFMVKIPMIPLHSWLPEAHVEASTIGSVILASLILKVGVYSLFKWNWFLFQTHSFPNISLFINLLALLSIIYSTILIFRLIDIKRIIAYSSIIHMNINIINIYTGVDILGSLLNTISHSFISSSYFIMIGLLYHRYNTRLWIYYRGLIHTMPLFSFFWIIVNINNMSFPFTLSFISEFDILKSCFINNPILSLFLFFSLFTNTIYIILLITKILFFKLSPFLSLFNDLSFKEILSFFPFLFLNILFGLFPLPLYLFFIPSLF